MSVVASILGGLGVVALVSSRKQPVRTLTRLARVVVPGSSVASAMLLAAWLLPAMVPARAAGARRSVSIRCQSPDIGGLGSGWRSRSRGAITAGPLAWPLLGYIASDSRNPFPHPSSYAPRDGLAPGIKALVVITSGPSVRLVVPLAERGRLSLDYDYIQPRNSGRGQPRFTVAQGAAIVTFQPCRSVQPSQFPGGFIVAGRQCARLEIYHGHSAKPIVARIPFGVPSRSCGSS